MLGIILLTGMCYTVQANGETNEAKLPEIAVWQDGHGYQEDGTQIMDGWAYDSVNPAGKYVLFGADGAVVRKAESQENMDISEDYTGTELVPAVLALRAEVFEGFQGTVLVVLQEKGGIEKSVKLNLENFFSLNIPVNSGDYVIQKAEAKEGDSFYKTEFSNESVHLPEKEMRVMKLCVLEDVTAEEKGIKKTEQITEEPPAEPQSEQHTEVQEENEDGKEHSKVQDMRMKKIIALIGGIGAACLAVICGLWKKRKRYY